MQVPIIELKCGRCGHTWFPKRPEVYMCPDCKTPFNRVDPEILYYGDFDEFFQKHDATQKKWEDRG